MVRTSRNAFEERLRWRNPPDHTVHAWLVQWAATLINRYRVGRDGKKPEQRLKGDDRNHRAIAEFRESVRYMPLAAEEDEAEQDGRAHELGHGLASTAETEASG